MKPTLPIRVAIILTVLSFMGGATLTKAQTVSVWLTTHDQSKKLAQQSSLTFVTARGGSNPVLPQLLTYSLRTPPAGASINANSGVITWRPAVAQSPSTPSVVVVVSDTGVPVMSSTQSFRVTVTSPVQPGLSLPEFTNHTIQFLVSGDTGPDYTVQMSTNLNSGMNWVNYFLTNSPSLPFSFADTAATNLIQRYYRIQLGT